MMCRNQNLSRALALITRQLGRVNVHRGEIHELRKFASEAELLVLKLIPTFQADIDRLRSHLGTGNSIGTKPPPLHQSSHGSY